MPSIDEILGALEESDSEEDTETTTAAPPAKDNRAFKELRDHAKRLEKETAKMNRELAELREFKSSITKAERAQQVQGAFKELGLNEKQAELFLRVTDAEEITVDSVKQFAQQYGLIVGDEDTTTVDGGFPPTNVSTTAESTGRMLSRDEFEKLAATNPTRARQYLTEGRVKWNNLRNAP